MDYIFIFAVTLGIAALFDLLKSRRLRRAEQEVAARQQSFNAGYERGWADRNSIANSAAKNSALRQSHTHTNEFLGDKQYSLQETAYMLGVEDFGTPERNARIAKLMNDPDLK